MYVSRLTPSTLIILNYVINLWLGYYAFFASIVSYLEFGVIIALLHLGLLALAWFEYLSLNAQDGKGVPLKVV
jgi:hypothetical protein